MLRISKNKSIVFNFLRLYQSMDDQHIYAVVFYFYLINSSMGDTKDEVKRYLQRQVNPLLKPMLEHLTQTRPPNIMQFIFEYAKKYLCTLFKEIESQKLTRMDSHDSAEDEQMTKEQQAAMAKRLQEKEKKNGGKKNSRKGISAEVFGEFNKKTAFVSRVIPKSPQSQQFLRNLLQKSIMFHSLSEQNMTIVINAMEELKCEAERDIIKQGQAGDVLYVIGSGEYDCSKIIGGKKTYLKTYKQGELFGELSLMYNAKRAASVKCSKAGVLFALDRLTFINIVQQSAITKRKEQEKMIGQIEILSEIQDEQKQQLCDTLKQERFNPGDYVVKEGEDGDRLYFIMEGNLVAEKDNHKTNKKDIVFKYKEKQYFGQIALLKNTVRQASIKAVTKCRLLSIGREEFKRLLGPLETILQRNMQKYKKFVAKV